MKIFLIVKMVIIEFLLWKENDYMYQAKINARKSMQKSMLFHWDLHKNTSPGK